MAEPAKLRRGPRPALFRRSEIRTAVAGAFEGGATTCVIQVGNIRVTATRDGGNLLDAAEDAENRMRDAFGE